MIYTFYSFKGGVGRSMAMAAVAYVFAQRGLRVLVIDFDLEAPGLERYFFEPERAQQVREHVGLMDLLQTYKLALTSDVEFNAARFRKWQSFIQEAVPSVPGAGYVDLMTAGQREPEAKLQEYASAVRSFDWQDFFHNWKGDQFFDWLRKQLLAGPDVSSAGYDVVLVDSRTGVTEMGGVCAYQLADCAVMLCAPNYQNIDGTLAVARDFRSEAVHALRRGRPLELLVLPARLEEHHKQREKFLSKFESTFERSMYLPRVLYELGLDYRALAQPYDPEFAVIERVVGESDSASGAIERFGRLADALTLLAAVPGKLQDQQTSVRKHLRNAHTEMPAVAQIADPTRRTSGFDAFIDCSRTDDTVAERLALRLREAGLSSWRDSENLRSGAGWFEQLNQLLAASDALVVIIGSDTPSSHLGRTIGIAQQRGRPRIIPVAIQDEMTSVAPNPEILAGLGLLDAKLLSIDSAVSDPVRFQLLLQSIRHAVPAKTSRAFGTSTIDRNPYPGERALSEDDSAYFFGRNRELQRLLGRTQTRTVTPLLGATGVGKTSLLCAGLIPALRRGPSSLKLAYVDCSTPEGEEQMREWLISGRLPDWLLLDSVDSFEIDGRPSAVETRVELVGRILEESGRRTKVVLALRDVLDDEARRYAFARWHLGDESLTDAVLPPMRPRGVEAAIERPAAQLGHVIEPGLTKLLIDSAGSLHSGIAQIARILPHLWTERRRGWVTTRTYESLGGTQGVFQSAVSSVYNGLTPAGQTAFKTLVATLSQFDGAMQLSAEAAQWRAIETIPRVAAADAIALRDRLASRHLIDLWRAPKDSAKAVYDSQNRPEGNVTVALIHGTPVHYGSTFTDANDPSLLLWRRSFASYVRAWQQGQRQDGAVISGLPLAEAEAVAERHRDELSEPELSLVQVSVAVRERQQAEARKVEHAIRESEEIRRARDVAENERQRAEDERLRAVLLAEAAERARRRSHRFAVTALLFATVAFLFAVAIYFTEQRASSSAARARLATLGSLVRGYAEAEPTAAAITLSELLPAPETPDIIRAIKFDLADRPLESALLQHGAPVRHTVVSPDGKIIVTSSLDKSARLWTNDGQLIASLPHPNSVWYAAFSPDGEILVTTAGGGIARLWSREGKLLRTLRGHTETAGYVAFSPDGNIIATASNDSTVRLWKRDGQLLKELKGHKKSVWYAVFSPDGQDIITASDDGTARVWSRDGEFRHKLDHNGIPVEHAAFSPDGLSILTAADDGNARLWSRQGKLRGQLIGHQEPVSYATFSPDGETIVTASRDGTARLWSRDGAELPTLSGHGKSVWYATFSADSKTVLTASDDRTARLWDLSGKMLAEFAGHRDAVRYAAFSADGQSVVTASNDGTARLWQLNGKLCTHLTGHRYAVAQATFSPDGQSILTASNDGTARLWDLDGKQLAELTGHRAPVVYATFSHDGQLIVTAALDNTARLWKRNGALLESLDTLKHQGPVSHAAFSPDGQILATTSGDAVTRLWNRDGKRLVELPGHKGFIRHVAFAPDGTRLVTASVDRTARLWSSEGQWLATLEHPGSVEYAAFSPDSRSIVTAAEDGIARVWSRDGGLLVELKGHQFGILKASFSSNGRSIVTASSDRTARIWSPAGKELAQLDHRASVIDATFSPNGEMIVTASEDQTMRLWSRDGRPIATLTGHRGSVTKAAFSPDGQSIVTASSDNTARLWPIGERTWLARVRQRARPCLTVEERRKFFVDENLQEAKAKVETCVAKSLANP